MTGPRHRCLCPECGERFQTARLDQHFCSKPCRKAWNNRRQTRGAQIYDLAMKYRDQRSKGDFADLTHLIDRFLREDKAADRKTYTDRPRGLERQ